MEQTRSQTPIRAVDAALHHHPGRTGAAAAVAAVTPAAPAAATVPAARGEHVHGGPVQAAPGAPPPHPVPPEEEQARPDAAAHLPPQRHSVRGQVLAALREALLTGELVPGQVYSAPALAGHYGVSPTPVREAMQRLASEGLVETVPNRGFRVTEHSARDLVELAEVRALLEIPTVLALARTLPAEAWGALRPLADATVTAAARGDLAAYAEADRAFHRALLELSGNRRLTLIAEDVLRRGHCTGGGGGGVNRAPALGLVPAAAEHATLLDALCARDLPAAERILRGHLAPTSR